MWYFLSPKIAFGEDSIEELAQLQGKKAFLVTDAVIHQLGYPDLVRQQLDEAGISMAIFDAVEPDPSLATVRECAAAITAYEPDFSTSALILSWMQSTPLKRLVCGIKLILPPFPRPQALVLTFPGDLPCMTQ